MIRQDNVTDQLLLNVVRDEMWRVEKNQCEGNINNLSPINNTV